MTELCLFPGQGSQAPGMGEALFARYPHLTDSASDCLGFDVKDKCMNSSASELSKTQVTQPLLYVVGALSYLKHVEETGVVPDYLAGHSLGEYVALFAAGCFDFISGLEIVAERGRLMSEVSGGIMFAVLGLPADAIVRQLDKLNFDQLTIANYNEYTQTVIAGYCENPRLLQEELIAAGAANVVQLNVSACFHTHFMKPTAEKLAQFLNRYRLSQPKIKVIANLTGMAYRKEDNVAEMLVKQVYSPVLWLQSMEAVLPKVESWQELGSGTVLTGIVTRIQDAMASTA
ncbi:ACP S-malonyltransferase [Teredinibacter turnerae]|uniref:Malonyl CoA-acyl carrier protein transacylase n=1 Tax=Teredinibacter turnerae (strain ATCC 39867 / T7901) TaxID=377629 RepID=C5BJH9_TERTT|nr:ACP S-malonyltransferase [Teredinibacter turnerae]ACR11036.1 malonyl CoA-acyl carrier protein transacylase [Teredinibacter turnerae T7901]